MNWEYCVATICGFNWFHTKKEGNLYDWIGKDISNKTYDLPLNVIIKVGTCWIDTEGKE